MKKYITANNWTISVGGRKFSPSSPGKLIFIEGLSEETIARLLRQRKIQEVDIHNSGIPEPENDNNLEQALLTENDDLDQALLLENGDSDDMASSLGKPISEMSMPELRALAKELCVPAPIGITRVELRTAIEEALEQ